ncbi:hypothetical protein PAPHI01_2801, partial [Pancytospora philotis]
MGNRQAGSSYECEIRTPEGRRVVEATYPLPKKMEEGTGKAIENLLDKKHIVGSKSSWVNNIRPVMKDNGEVRITTNLVRLNKLVELDGYSLPRMEHMIFSLRGQTWFSKVDLKDGFFQIPLRKEDRHKTAFRYQHRLYEWTVMPMGFKNAPAVFQRYMDQILKEEIGVSCYVYVDDILIYGKTEAEHDERVKRVLAALSKHNMAINDKKSEFKKRTIEFLGYNLSENSISLIREPTQG